MNCLGDRGVAGDHLERLTGGARRVEDRDQYRGDVLAGDVAAAGLLGDRDLPRPRIVDEMTRPNDRPVQRRPRPDVVVRSAFRAQVRDENRIAGLVGRLDVGAHRGDHHIAADLRGLGGIGEQDRCVAVDRLLARRSAARARTRREHHRVGSSEMSRDIVDRGALEIDDHRFGARCFEVRRRAPGFRMKPATESPRCESNRSRIRAIWPCPPAMTTRMSPCYGPPFSCASRRKVSRNCGVSGTSASATACGAIR